MNRKWIWWTVGALALILAAGGATYLLVRPTNSPAAVPTTTLSPPHRTYAPVAEDSAIQACKQLATAINAGKDSDPDTMTTVGNLAAQSGNDSIRIDGNLLVWGADLTRQNLAAGTADDGSDLVRSADQLEQACKRIGL